MKIAYLVHNLDDPAVERRCRMLERGGSAVALAGFVRGSDLRDDVARRRPMVLGRSIDAAFSHRALATLRAAAFNGPLARHFASCDAVMARNLEQLAIARTLVGNRPLVYECLDIHRTLVGSSAVSHAIRAVEGMLLPRVDLLVTSSPAFVREHFALRPLAAPTLLMENKLLVEGHVEFGTPPLPGPPWRIGWFGMLRCRRTLAFLNGLVSAAGGSIEVLIAGKPSPAELPGLAEHVAAVPGMRFTGPYSYADLANLYGQVHFAWTIDWFEEGLNSSWLLPNRIYEALAHRAIPIALADIEVGRWLAAHGGGLLVRDPEEARARLLAMTPAAYQALQTGVEAIDRADVVADDADCRCLVDAIAQVRR